MNLWEIQETAFKATRIMDFNLEEKLGIDILPLSTESLRICKSNIFIFSFVESVSGWLCFELSHFMCPSTLVYSPGLVIFNELLLLKFWVLPHGPTSQVSQGTPNEIGWGPWAALGIQSVCLLSLLSTSVVTGGFFFFSVNSPKHSSSYSLL